MVRAGSRALWIKLAILALVIWFVSTRVDLGDRLVIREAPGGSPADAPSLRAAAAGQVSVPTYGGETLTLVAGDALPVEVRPAEGSSADGTPAQGSPVEVWVRQDGRQVRLDPALVGDGGPLAIQPGLRSTLREIDAFDLVVALLVFAPVPLLLAGRWFLLLRAAGIDIGWRPTLRLTWIGMFFNTVLPGGAGGDVVKLIEIGRYSDRRSEALGTMLADRVLGLLVLIVLGAAAALLLQQDTHDLVTVVVVVGVILVVGGAIYLSPFLRARIDVGALLERLPLGTQLRRIDEAIVALRGAPGALAGAVGLSCLAQLSSMSAALLCARAVGLEAVGLFDMVRVVPIAYAANAIPISPGGLGLLEVAFQELLYRQGLSSLAQGFMVGLLLRAVAFAWSLPGLVAWVVTTNVRKTDRARVASSP